MKPAGSAERPFICFFPVQGFAETKDVLRFTGACVCKGASLVGLDSRCGRLLDSVNSVVGAEVDIGIADLRMPGKQRQERDSILLDSTNRPSDRIKECGLELEAIWFSCSRSPQFFEAIGQRKKA